MASTGNIFPGSGTSVDRASATAWTNPGNVVSDDGNDTTAAVPTDYLVCTSFNFSSIPDNSTILGVTVRVEASETGSGNSNYVPQLISDATPTLIGAAKSAVTVNGTTKVISTTGGTSDLWSATLTPAIVKNSGFGVAIWSTDSGNTLAIDFVTIAIEYQVNEASLGATEATDSASFAGTDTHVLGATEAADTAALTGTDNQALGTTEAADAAAFAFEEGPSAEPLSLAATEAADTASLAGTDNQTLAATEAADTAAAAGSDNHELAATEAGDTAAATGTDNHALAATEAGDTAAATATDNHELAATEAADAAGFEFAEDGTAALGAAEQGDIAAVLFSAPESDWKVGAAFVRLPPAEIRLRASEAPDTAHFRIEWTGRGAMRRRREEMALQSIH